MERYLLAVCLRNNGRLPVIFLSLCLPFKVDLIAKPSGVQCNGVKNRGEQTKEEGCNVGRLHPQE